MPGYDGTGPGGLGPMTGGGRGFCAGYPFYPYYSGSPIGLPSSYPRPTCKDCANFKDGICTLDNVAVDLNGPACPRFVPKAGVGQPYPPQIVPSSPPYMQYGYPPPTYPATTYPGYPQMPQYPMIQMSPAPSLTKDQEQQMLEQTLKTLESQLDEIRKRLQELQGSQSP